MPVLVSAFCTALVWALASFAGRLIVGLGIGVVAYQGVDLLIQEFNTRVASLLSDIPAEYTAGIVYFGFSQALAIILTAFLARFGTQTAYKFALRRAAPAA